MYLIILYLAIGLVYLVMMEKKKLTPVWWKAIIGWAPALLSTSTREWIDKK